MTDAFHARRRVYLGLVGCHLWGKAGMKEATVK